MKVCFSCLGTFLSLPFVILLFLLHPAEASLTSWDVWGQREHGMALSHLLKYVSSQLSTLSVLK